MTVPSAAVARNWSSPAFGFGGFVTVFAPATSSSPMPSERGAAAGVALRGRHQRALDLVRRPVGMLREQHRGRAGDHRRRERRPAQLHVAGRDDVIRPLEREHAVRRDRPDQVAAGSGEVGLREAVRRVAPCRPRCDDVVRGRGRRPDVGRADGDHERIVARRERHAALLAVGRVVPRGSHDRDAVEPQLLDRLIERVEEEARAPGGMEREVGDANVVLRLVLEDPVAGGNDVGHGRLALVVHDVDGEQVRGRRDTGVARRSAGCDAGDERAVAVAVARRVRRQARQVDLAEQAAAEVRPRSRRRRSRRRRSSGRSPADHDEPQSARAPTVQAQRCAFE